MARATTSVILAVWGVAAVTEVPAQCRQADLKQEVLATLSASADGRWHERSKLVGLGARAFPVYDALLADPKVEDQFALRIFGVLCEIKGDRSRYILPAQQALRNPNWHVRLAAVRLLGQIASPKDTSPIVALMFDNHDLVAYNAASALASVGGPGDLIAMDAYLRSSAVRGWHPAYLAEISKQRDRLRDRLAAADKGTSVSLPLAPPPRPVER